LAFMQSHGEIKLLTLLSTLSSAIMDFLNPKLSVSSNPLCKESLFWSLVVRIKYGQYLCLMECNLYFFNVKESNWIVKKQMPGSRLSNHNIIIILRGAEREISSTALRFFNKYYSQERDWDIVHLLLVLITMP